MDITNRSAMDTLMNLYNFVSLKGGKTGQILFRDRD